MIDTSSFDEIMKARSGYYKDNPKNRHLGRVGIPYGNNKRFVDDELIEFNDRFNKELDRYKNGEMNVNEVIHLGKAKGVLAEITQSNNSIVLRQRVVSKGIRKKHNVDIEQIRNLPILISDPLMIFKRKEGDFYSVLIRTKDNNKKNIFVAIRLNQDNPSQQDKDRGIFIVDDIKSFHGREIENIIYPIVENESLVWVNKKDSLELLSSAKSTPQSNDIQDYLSDAVNVIRKFENTNERNTELNIINKDKINKAISSETAFEKEVNGSSPLQHSLEKGVTLSTFSPDSLSAPKDTPNINNMQQLMDEIIEKAKKASPIGIEKTWGSKVYINAGIG